MRESLQHDERADAATAAIGVATSLVVSAAPAAAAPRIVVGPGSEIDIVQNETAEGIEVAAIPILPDDRN